MLLVLYLLAVNPYQWQKYGCNLQNTHTQIGQGRLSSAAIKWSYNMGTTYSYGSALVDLDDDGFLEAIVGSTGG